MKRKKRAWSLEATAYHEAGHAAVALLLGCKVHKITIAPEPETGAAGYVTVRGATGSSIEWDTSGPNRWRVEKDVQHLLAGEIAQRLFAPRSVRRCHGEVDRHSVCNLLSYVCDDDSMPLYYKMLSMWTKNLLSKPRHWELVKSLAKTLLDERTMSRKRVRQWYRDYRDEEIRRMAEARKLTAGPRERDTKKEG